MMYLSTLTFHLSTLPDFDRLKQRGWAHPLLGGELMTSSLIKTFRERWQIQIVRHKSWHWDYAEAFIHDVPERPVMKKGEGDRMDCETAVWLVERLYEELEE